MTERAEGTFQLTGWDEQTYQELAGGAKLTRAHIAQDFSGSMAAKGDSESLMCYREDGTASFTGLTRLVGQLNGRPGSFVVQADGTYDGSAARTRWVVIPGSGTDELRGLRGEGSAVAPGGPSGSFSLDYDLS